MVRKGVVAWCSAMAVGAGVLAGCGGSTPVLFAGTCLEPLYQCFNASGPGTCSYRSDIQQAKLLFANGSYVNSDSRGSGPNRCFPPAGSACFTVTRIDDATRSVANTNGSISATVVDRNDGTLEVRCVGAEPVTISKPTVNPSFEDLRRCVTQ